MPNSDVLCLSLAVRSEMTSWISRWLRQQKPPQAISSLTSFHSHLTHPLLLWPLPLSPQRLPLLNSDLRGITVEVCHRKDQVGLVAGCKCSIPTLFWLQVWKSLSQRVGFTPQAKPQARWLASFPPKLYSEAEIVVRRAACPTPTPQ